MNAGPLAIPEPGRNVDVFFQHILIVAAAFLDAKGDIGMFFLEAFQARQQPKLHKRR